MANTISKIEQKQLDCLRRFLKSSLKRVGTEVLLSPSPSVTKLMTIAQVFRAVVDPVYLLAGHFKKKLWMEDKLVKWFVNQYRIQGIQLGQIIDYETYVDLHFTLVKGYNEPILSHVMRLPLSLNLIYLKDEQLEFPFL